MGSSLTAIQQSVDQTSVHEVVNFMCHSAKTSASATLCGKDHTSAQALVNHALLVAAEDDDVQSMREALEAGADPDTRHSFGLAWIGVDSPSSAGGKKKKKCRRRFNSMMYAGKNGSVAATTLLVNAGARVNVREEDGMTPLHFAAMSGNLNVCRLLRGSEATLRSDDFGKFPLDYVAENLQHTPAQRAEWNSVLGSVCPDIAEQA
mmetsp:Transcript_61436/g.163504  ORF Transcript_61436/g.163504 Transcript_61436/m.163504 type:complete len:206 (-) Transcript_61436:455-1072(-)|eukprot:CAMPEP_0194505816 /NCGR_PEP_ID=MMETSP0253-20130528/33044_1 /TAXON_ID=2966 /ORGANISM="Noctiluca scintillans" /LENGTH=205 /DNA_ID=CAMNT_0039348435 /DNA_START=12 /DNA_END=629 /DNA_ORIENTATION=+